MKKWNILKALLAVFVASQFMISCKTSDDVVSGKLLQKRKYTKGYHVSNAKHKDNRTATVENFKAEEAVATKQDSKKPVTRIEPENDNNNTVIEPENELTAKADEPVAEKKEKVASDFPGSRILGVRIPFLKKETVDAVDKAQPADSGTLALVSFILGVCSLVFLWVPYLGLITPVFALAAIILAAVGWDDGNIFAVLGLVFGILWFFLFLIVLIAFASLFAF